MVVELAFLCSKVTWKSVVLTWKKCIETWKNPGITPLHFAGNPVNCHHCLFLLSSHLRISYFLSKQSIIKSAENPGHTLSQFLIACKPSSKLLCTSGLLTGSSNILFDINAVTRGRQVCNNFR